MIVLTTLVHYIIDISKQWLRHPCTQADSSPHQQPTCAVSTSVSPTISAPMCTPQAQSCSRAACHMRSANAPGHDPITIPSLHIITVVGVTYSKFTLKNSFFCWLLGYFGVKIQNPQVGELTINQTKSGIFTNFHLLSWRVYYKWPKPSNFHL
jgi:hypothetical protein